MWEINSKKERSNQSQTTQKKLKSERKMVKTYSKYNSKMCKNIKLAHEKYFK